MRLDTHLFIVVSISLWTLSCSPDPRAATKRNFERIISSHLKTDRPCIIASVPYESADFRGQHRPSDQLEPLVHVGLVSEKPGNVRPGMFGLSLEAPPNQTVPGLRYELTQKAARYAPDKAHARRFPIMGNDSQQLCYADKSLVDIVRWTEPSPALGQTITEVTYSYKLVNVAEWAKDPGVGRVYYTSQALVAVNQPQEGKIALMLMSDGWRVPDSIR